MKGHRAVFVLADPEKGIQKFPIWILCQKPEQRLSQQPCEAADDDSNHTRWFIRSWVVLKDEPLLPTMERAWQRAADPRPSRLDAIRYCTSAYAYTKVWKL